MMNESRSNIKHQSFTWCIVHPLAEVVRFVPRLFLKKERRLLVMLRLWKKDSHEGLVATQHII